MAQGDGPEVGWLDEIVDRIREIHDSIIQTSGGMFGEHTASLYAVCARPFQSAFSEFPYNDAYERSAALFHGIICDHAFVDGNKRTATVVALMVLAAHHRLTNRNPPSQLQVRLLGEVALEAAKGRLDVDETIDWLRRIFEPR